MIEASPIFNNHFTGFELFDPSTQKSIYSFNEDKYFTPASNTKILTLYTALSLLPDTLPSIRYAERQDSVWVKGMGDPTLLHELWPDHSAFKFFQQTDKKIFLVTDALQDDVLGAGWAWDDYQDDYQAEKSALPLYGNLAKFSPQLLEHGYATYPHYFQSRFSSDSYRIQENNSVDRPVIRSLSDNNFDAISLTKNPYYIPYKTDISVLRDLLKDTLKRDIQLAPSKSLDTNLQWKILKGVPADSVYAQMMKVSDNFIAEQLLLLSDSYLLDSMNTSQAIGLAKRLLFADAPDPIYWYDGSGLSRYDLITPRTIIYILNKVKNRLTMNGIKRIFPSGGVGTLSNWYKADTPYIYAKTGSLSNIHALSGFIHTHKGNDLIFSFMHSNYTGSVNPIRMEMQKTLEYIRDNY